MSADSTPEQLPPLPPVTMRRHIEHDVLVGALPHPILVLAADERVIYANVAAETFFQSSQAVLKRQQLGVIVSFDCPLIALARQVARNGTTVNEYGVLISTPKVQAPRLVDIYGGPLPDAPELVLLMLQQRSMAQRSSGG